MIRPCQTVSRSLLWRETQSSLVLARNDLQPARTGGVVPVPSEDAVSVQRSFNRAPEPVVMMFQPSSFEVLTSDRLEEWQQLAVERAGLSEDAVMMRGPLPTVCGCPVQDDCDAL